jgi:hypothetical protein
MILEKVKIRVLDAKSFQAFNLEFKLSLGL